MSIEPVSFLDEGDESEPAAEAEVSTPEAPPEAEPAPEPEPEAQPEPTPEPEPQAPQERTVPLAAVLDERDRRKALEQEVANLRAQIAPPTNPDPYEDPEGFATWQYQQGQVQLQQTALNLKLDMSEEMARQGADGAIVDTARDWAKARFQQSPAFYQEVMSQRHPYGYVIEQYKRDQALASLGDPSELDAFRAWKAAQAETQPIPAASAASPKPSAPPRSLASAPSAGGLQTATVEDDGDGYDAEFKRKK